MGTVADRTELTRAVDLALSGDWDGAHKIEGDAGNARYWYGKAGQAYEAFPDPQAELAAIKAVLSY